MRLKWKIARKTLGATVLIAVALMAFSIGTVVLGGQFLNPERDGAVASALAVARQRGEPDAQVVGAIQLDADALRLAGHNIPPAVQGQLWAVTLSGSFDAGMVPPGMPLARDVHRTLSVYLRDGTIIGVEGAP